ncbi:hypothetical protein DE146DRAFT_350998 [Phaeosphaeria sp. MPI-PUGE-AT-0046c]|nr:hypothetical protein DE146DRAFT_350998 [Phaeosphaeria sp. MPI-PUGE-AT-0046c]
MQDCIRETRQRPKPILCGRRRRNRPVLRRWQWNARCAACVACGPPHQVCSGDALDCPTRVLFGVGHGNHGQPAQVQACGEHGQSARCTCAPGLHTALLCTLCCEYFYHDTNKRNTSCIMPASVCRSQWPAVVLFSGRRKTTRPWTASSHLLTPPNSSSRLNAGPRSLPNAATPSAQVACLRPIISIRTTTTTTPPRQFNAACHAHTLPCTMRP